MQFDQVYHSVYHNYDEFKRQYEKEGLGKMEQPRTWT